MEGPFQVEIIRAWDQAAPRWRALQARATGTPFQQASWLAPWYDVFGAMPGIEPVIVAISDRRSGEDLLLVPLVRRTVGSLRTIEFADLWITDYNAPLIGPGAPARTEEAQALWHAIEEGLPPADFVRLTKMPAEINGIKNPLTLVRGVRPSPLSEHLVVLPERWEDYLASLKRDMRYSLRKRWRRLSEMGNATFRWITDESEGLRVLDALQAIQTARFTSLGIRHVFSDPAYMRFYRQQVCSGLADGSIVLTSLDLDGEIIAAFLAVTDGRRCTLIRSSQLTDGKWGPLGLGKLLIEKAMQALHARGCRIFDLSIGDHPYKHDFGVVAAPLFELEVARTWRGVPTLCRQRTLALIKKTPWMASFAGSIRRGLLALVSSG